MSEIEKNSGDNISRILVANKCDLEDQRAVSKEEGQELADHYGIRFLETSAKDRTDVDVAFNMVTREIKNRVAVSQPKRQTAQPQTLTKSQAVKQQKKGGCC